jgi:hypothetical protein
MTKRDFPPIHPGEVLLEDFLKPMQISQYHLAQAIGVPRACSARHISTMARLGPPYRGATAGMTCRTRIVNSSDVGV